MATDENTQAMTQGEVDPRRFGRNNSGLAENDIADVLCILHPASPAAFRVVEYTAKKNPQHVLQNHHLSDSIDIDLAETQTERTSFHMETDEANGAKDLALRFSSSVCDPSAGFVFGRNPTKCDINLDSTDRQKRVSNIHFRIYVNEQGVLMLGDTSTNGTIVDGESIGGKRHPSHAKARMIQSGSIIEILAVLADDAIKFIVREPSREGFQDRYITNFRNYLQHVAIIEQNKKAAQELQVPDAAARGMIAAPLRGPPNGKQIGSGAPLLKSNFGMHWDGGDQYNCVGVLGTGAFATVYVIATVHDGDLFACKELEKKRFVKNGVLDQRLSNEMMIMQRLRHDNIVQYNDYHETEQHLYIIMEYVRCGDLQGYMKSHNTLPEPLAKEMTRQILLALRYLHEQGITHRDIKPDNILIRSEDPFVVKLTDFGLSKVVKNNDTFLKTFCGTLLYCAPEVFPHYDTYMAGKKPKRRRHVNEHPKNHMYGQSVDIWSYAAVLWYCLCGQPPFEGVVDPTGKAMFERIVETSINIKPLQDRGLSDECIDLLVKMLTVDPVSRPTEQDCLNHPWLNDGIQLAPSKALTGLGVVLEEGEDASDDSMPVGNDVDQDVQPNSQDSQENRVVKRQKGESFLPQKNNGVLPSETSFHSLEIINDTGTRPDSSKPLVKPARLFGEISNSALQSSGVLGPPMNHDVQVPQSATVLPHGGPGYVKNMEQLQIQDGHPPAPQQGWHQHISNSEVVGFESMVRDLNMDSGNSNSNSHSENQQPSGQYYQTPSIDSDRAVHADGTPHEKQSAFETPRPVTGRSDEVTPRPAQPGVFSRQINLGISPSLYYDPMDPSTHNPEAASKLSGIDFTKHMNIVRTSDVPQAETKWTKTNDIDIGSNAQNVPGQEITDKENFFPNQARARSVPQDIQNIPSAAQDIDGFKRPHTVFGRISSVPGSYTSVNILLKKRTTTWGRDPTVSEPFLDKLDTRVPKKAWEVQFYASGVDDVEAQGKDWTLLDGLKAFITTYANGGIKINGQHLQYRDNEGRPQFGVLRNGDVITIWDNKGKNKTEYLKLMVEIYVGDSAKERRPGESFLVEVQKDATSAQSRESEQ